MRNTVVDTWLRNSTECNDLNSDTINHRTHKHAAADMQDEFNALMDNAVSDNDEPAYDESEGPLSESFNYITTEDEIGDGIITQATSPMFHNNDMDEDEDGELLQLAFEASWPKATASYKSYHLP